jgi:hypothetical protein
VAAGALGPFDLGLQLLCTGPFQDFAETLSLTAVPLVVVQTTLNDFRDLLGGMDTGDFSGQPGVPAQLASQ